MSSYPRLTEMGVLHPEQIVRYSVSSMDHTDYLRIVYNRPKASLLPVSRTYHFPRVQSTAKASDAAEPSVVMQSNPTFIEVINELQELLNWKAEKLDTAATMLEELGRLEDDISCHVENLRSLIEKIK
jgi:hypothetical protein